MKLVVMAGLLLLSLVSFGKPVKIAISSTPNNLSPFFNTDANSQNINRLVHRSLIDFDENMKPICNLCESYKVDVKDGKQIISFVLKKNINFWDGEEVTAKSVENSWKYFTDKKEIKSIFRFAFGRIESVKVRSKYSLDLIYKEFKLDNLPNLVLFKILKLDKTYKKGRPTIEQMIGAGEYKITKSKELAVTLSPISSELSELQFKVVKDETTLALKLLNKEVEVSVSDMSPRKFDWLRKNSELEFHEKNSTNFYFININHSKKPFNDQNVRKAFSHLIDRKKLSKYKYRNNVDLAHSMFSKSFDDLFINFPIDEYSQEKAAKLLKSSGYVKDKIGWNKEGDYLTFDWKSNNSKSTVELVQTIKSSLESFGIKVNLSIQEWGIFSKAVKRSEFDLAIGQWIGFTGPDMLNYVFSSKSMPPKGGNRGRYSNEKMDKLLELAVIEPNAERRNFYYKQVLEIANNDYSYINLWHPKIIWLARDCVNNITVYPNGSFLGLNKVENNCGN